MVACTTDELNRVGIRESHYGNLPSVWHCTAPSGMYWRGSYAYTLPPNLKRGPYKLSESGTCTPQEWPLVCLCLFRGVQCYTTTHKHTLPPTRGYSVGRSMCMQIDADWWCCRRLTYDVLAASCEVAWGPNLAAVQPAPQPWVRGQKFQTLQPGVSAHA